MSLLTSTSSLTGCRYGNIQTVGEQYPSIPISSSSQVNIIWIKVSGVWKQATTWIKVSGVWKTSTPKIKVAGTWR